MLVSPQNDSLKIYDNTFEANVSKAHFVSVTLRAKNTTKGS